MGLGNDVCPCDRLVYTGDNFCLKVAFVVSAARTGFENGRRLLRALL